MNNASPEIQLGQILIDQGSLNRDRLDAALAEQTVTHERLSKILVRNGFVRHREVIAALREISPAELLEESVIVPEIPAEILIATRTMIIADLPDTLYVATLSRPVEVSLKLTPYIKGRSLSFVPASPQRLEGYITQLRMSDTGDSIMEHLIQRALNRGASDIHVIPRHSSYTVKYRRLGVLELAHEGPTEEYLSLSSRLKDKSGIDQAERRVSQDGSFSVDYNGRLIDLRVATIPTVDGERIVLRVLDPDSINPKLDSLGITHLKAWRDAVSHPDGICLICGPTGSGKTTTLNATIREMNFLERSIYTVEDPVEYRLAYAGQVNVNHSTGMDFAAAVRAFLRADPDVIVVGEVRDIETARNAIKASETGHLVIATLHTQSIRGAISRLRDIGIPPNDLRFQLRGIMVQRLVRTLCYRCDGVEGGCDACHHTRYTSRTIVSEAVYLPDVDATDRLIAGEVFWETMVENAIEKERNGITDMHELRRVFGAQVDHTIAGIADE